MVVMIVDDSSVMRKMIARILQQGGIQVSELIEAPNGRDALAKASARARDIDLIMTDVNMPEMDGIQFVAALRQVFLLKDTPVVMVTTEASLDMVHKGKSAGATGYVLKPFTPETLRAKVDEVMALRPKGGVR